MEKKADADGSTVRRDKVHWRFEIGMASIGLAGAAIVVALDALKRPDVLTVPLHWGLAIAVVTLAYVAIGIVLVQHSWEKTPKNHDPGTEEKPLFRTAFAWLILYLTILAWAAFGKANGAMSFPWEFSLEESSTNQTVFGVLLASAFIPLFYGFHLVAVEATENTGRRNYLSDPDEDVSWLTLGLTVGVSSLVAFGAWAAGQRLFTMSENFGIWAVGVVVASFLAFIIAANILGFREPRDKGEAHAPKTKTAGVAQTTSEMFVGLDSALVRLIAPLSGATLPGMVSGKLAIVFVLLPLSALGFALPAPVGLFPIGFAILLILAMGRRWAWVEDDREKALRLQTTRSEKFRIGFNNDMRDEALLGYAFLFVLVPLGLRQIQLHYEFFGGPGPDALEVARSEDIIAWLNFFGGELAKGVPIVDWFDIYDIQQERPFEPKDASGRHIIFGSRLMIDIVIIAALLQAIGIMQRNKGQENLFKSGQVDFFDPFMEKKILIAAYEKAEKSGLPPLKSKWLNFFEEHRKKSKDLDRGDFYYNPRRLNELSIELQPEHSESQRRMKAVVDWLSGDLITGVPEERAVKLVEAHRKLLVSESSDSDNPEERRKFERYFDDLITDLRHCPAEDIKVVEFQALSALLAQTSSDRGLDVHRSRAYRMLGSKPGLQSARVLAARIAKVEDGPHLLDLDADEAAGWSVKRQGRYQDRSLALEQIFAIKTDEHLIPPLERLAFQSLHRRVIEHIQQNDVQGVQELLDLLINPSPLPSDPE